MDLSPLQYVLQLLRYCRNHNIHPDTYTDGIPFKDNAYQRETLARGIDIISKLVNIFG